MKKRVIEINNNKDLKLIYKTILYNNVLFDTTNNKLKELVKALNIKNKKERIMYVYDSCCNKIDNYSKNKNMCGFKNNKCYTQQHKDCKYKNGCCRKCIYQSPNGCTTSNLTCKLFNCSEVKKRFKVIEYQDLELLKLLSTRQRVIIKHDYFSSREEVLTDLYIGSITIFVVRLIYRYIRKNIV